jgi:hypothetical protein
MRSFKLISSLIFFAVLLAGCAAGRNLLTEPGMVNENDTYEVILYGGRYQDDLKTVAILYKTGGGYVIEPLAPKFDYYIRKNYPGPQAVKVAREWVRRFSPNVAGIKTSRIMTRDGHVIGYEIRPLYQPFVYGTMDVVDTSYTLKKNGVVKAWIRLIPTVERNMGDHLGRTVLP